MAMLADVQLATFTLVNDTVGELIMRRSSATEVERMMERPEIETCVVPEKKMISSVAVVQESKVLLVSCAKVLPVLEKTMHLVLEKALKMKLFCMIRLLPPRVTTASSALLLMLLK